MDKDRVNATCKKCFAGSYVKPPSEKEAAGRQVKRAVLRCCKRCSSEDELIFNITTYIYKKTSTNNDSDASSTLF